jgi:subtilisin family serine protease/mannose-6-phosphate isomerase-like protein (cupin superfamily)
VERRLSGTDAEPASAWILLVPAADDPEFAPISGVGTGRTRPEVVAEVAAALDRLASRAVPTGVAVRPLPGVGALLVEERGFVQLDPTVGVFANVEREVTLPVVRRVSDQSPTSGPVLYPPGPDLPDPTHLFETNVLRYRECTGREGAGVIVGVIDTGCDTSHPDLAGKDRGFAEVDASGFVRQVPAYDCHGHGTHVCGLIGGTWTGVVPSCTLAIANVRPRSACDHGFTVAQFAAALDWLVVGTLAESGEPVGADVVNLSQGHNEEIPEYLPLVRFAREKYQVLMTAAIGNDGTFNRPHLDDSPGHLAPVVGVGATDFDLDVWIGTDWRVTPGVVAVAPKPDICTPGGRQLPSCAIGGGYVYSSGTSMAAAVACGIASLLIEEDPSLRLDADALECKLYDLAKYVSGPNSSRVKHGRLVMPDCSRCGVHDLSGRLEAGFRYAEKVVEFETSERCFILEVANDEGDADVSIARARVRPGVTTAWHIVTGTDERYVIVSGQGRAEVGDLAPADVGPGDVVRIPAGARQRITNVGVEDLVFFCVCSPRFRRENYRALY